MYAYMYVHVPGNALDSFPLWKQSSSLYGVISGEKFDAAKERQLAGWERSRYTSFSRNMKVNLAHAEGGKVIYHYYCGIFYVEQ